MDEAKAMAAQQQHQHQQLLLQQHKQQQQQQQQQQQTQQHQQFLLLQQLQKHQQAQQQAAAISRFPSNIDAHLRPPGLHLRPGSINLHQNPNPNPTAPVPNLQSNPSPSQPPSQQLQQQQQQQQLQLQQQQQHQQQQLQQRAMRPGNQAELQMAYQDAWRVCHPDIKRPFGSLEDACERLLPYHVVADYEAEEDDRILDSDPTGQMLSRSQQWDHNISAKISEFIATFEKQVLAFNIITRKRTLGEFRSEERLMFEQALMQEEKRNLLELKAEIELRGKAAGKEAHDAKMRMAAMMQNDQTRGESQANEMMVRGLMRTGAHVGSQSSDVPVGHSVGEQEQVHHPNEMVNGWGNNNTQGDEKEGSEDLLNDEEAENGDMGMHDSWREVGEFDLNTR